MKGIVEIAMEWRLVFMDLFSAKWHTDDFNSNRGRILFKRVQIISALMAVLALLWLPIDYISLDQEHFIPVFWMRMVWFGGLLLLAFGWQGTQRSCKKGVGRLLGMTLLFSGTYLYLWLNVFDPSVAKSLIAGYSFLPYIAIIMLAVFPLTLIEAGLSVTVTILLVLITDLQMDVVLDQPVWIKLWLMLVIASIIFWASASQLHGLMGLYREATRDTVTGLVNRRLVLEELERIRQEMTEQQKPGAILLADLDRFKKVNDEYGHLNGDRVLRDFAQAVVEVDPSLTVAGRFGGEEFLMIVEQADETAAMAVAERVNQTIRERLVIGLDGEELRYTTSLGVATFVEGESQDGLLERADNALYEAKGAGRDCAILAPAPTDAVS